MSSLRNLTILTILAPLALLATSVAAQNYPAKAVRYVMPTTGASEVVGRLIAQGMSDALGQQVFVDVRAGAGGNIGAEIAAKSPPDGYTILQLTQSHTVNVSLYRQLGYDLLRDFSAVTKADLSPLMVVAHPSFPVKSVAELVKLAKARPGAINYASAGAGTSTFLAAELFKLTADVKLTEIPYRGGGPAMTAVVSGEVPLYFAPIATALPFIREARLRALAMCTEKRISVLPGLPTVAESGYPGFEASNWHGLAVPAKTPKEIIATLHSAALTALKRPDIAKRIHDLGMTPVGDSPAEFAEFIRADIEKWRKIVRQRNLTAD